MRTYSLLFLFFLSVFILTSGGRIASSDETAFFLEVQSLVENGTLAIPDNIVSNGVYGSDGRFYVGGGVGFTLISLPFYLLGKFAATVSGLPAEMQVFVVKAGFSLTNQFLCALIGCVFFALCRSSGMSVRWSFFASIVLLFTTNLFPYAKSAMREPLLTLCLLTAFYYMIRYTQDRRSLYLHLAGGFLFLLIQTKISMVIVLPAFALYWVSRHGQSWRDFSVLRRASFWSASRILLLWLGIGVTVVALINTMLFGSPWSSGYTGKPQPFNTPLLTGLYGLLLSPGKSFFLYAPVTLLALPSWKTFKNRLGHEFVFIVALTAILILVHAKYFAWAGDGSWGPRYLIPILPYFLWIAVTGLQIALEQKAKFVKFAAIFLSITGFVVQLGGLSVYHGSYLRHIGEFPYTRSFEDPEFLYRSHFVPEFSPIVGHWRLLGESIDRHRSGWLPQPAMEKSEARLPVSDQRDLEYIIDYWFMYARYAGFPWMLILTVMGLQMFFVLLLGLWSRRRILTETHSVD